MKYALLFLVGCSSAPVAPPASQCDSCISDHAACAQSCAACCETQPYVEAIGKTDPIHACSASDLPSDWSVAWCRTDCENACQDCSTVCP